MSQVQSQTLQKAEKIGVYEIKSVIQVGRTTILYRVWNEHMNAMEVLAEYFPGNLARRDEDGRSIVCKAEQRAVLLFVDPDSLSLP